jgi:hypothetical protein
MLVTGDSAFVVILNFLFAVSFRTTRILLEAVAFFRADIFLGESGGRLD